MICLSIQERNPLENGTAQVEVLDGVAGSTAAIHSVVIDCSTFNFIDSVGLHTLPSVSITYCKLFFFLSFCRL